MVVVRRVTYPLTLGVRVDESELVRRFEFHPATEVSGPLHDAARGVLWRAAKDVLRLTPVGREQSLAVTALEEAMFWTNAAIARADH